MHCRASSIPGWRPCKCYPLAVVISRDGLAMGGTFHCSKLYQYSSLLYKFLPVLLLFPGSKGYFNIKFFSTLKIPAYHIVIYRLLWLLANMCEMDHSAFDTVTESIPLAFSCPWLAPEEIAAKMTTRYTPYECLFSDVSNYFLHIIYI